MRRIGQYLKENKLYIAVMLIGSLAFIWQMKQVVLYADDYSLGIISKGGLKEIFEHFGHSYRNWGGGLTPLNATLFLLFDLKVWKVFQCAIVILIVVLVTKMITQESKKNKAFVASIIWLCLFMLNIWVSREVLYWLDGALAYQLTAFEVLLYFYYLYTRIHLKISKKYDKIVLPVIAFLAGWTSPQVGLIAILLPMILIVWEKFIKKEKVSKFYYVTTIIGILGFAILYFAPGNMARMNIQSAEFASYSLLEKVMFRVEEVYGLIFDYETYHFTGIPFYLLLTLGLNAMVGYSLFNQEKNRKIKILTYVMSGIQIAFLFVYLAIVLKVPYAEVLAGYTIKFQNLLKVKQEGGLTLEMLVPYAITTIVMLSSVIEALLISLKTKNPILVTTLVSGLIVQGLMVMAPSSPFRTTYFSILFLWVAIAYLLHLSAQKEIKVGMILVLLITMYDFNFGIVALLAYFTAKTFFNNKQEINTKHEVSIMLMVILVMASLNYKEMIENYKINKEIYYQNIARIEEYKIKQEKGMAEKELYLLLPKQEVYGFTPMVGIEWIEDALKEYFELGDIILKAENVE